MKHYFILQQLCLINLLLAMFITPNLHSQNLFEYWGVKWRDYQQEPKNNLSFLHRRFFRDTVKVAEMKEAFSKYKNVTCYKSVYEGFDSVYFPMEGHGSSIMLISPLRRHPDRKVRESRGVWSFPRCVLVDIFDKYCPNAEIWAYGSRLGGDFHNGSDLDLVIKSFNSNEPKLFELKELLRESNIPF